MASDLREQINEQLDQLSTDEQVRVLKFAAKIAGQRPLGVPGKNLLRFAGVITPEDAEIMMRVVEEGCGKVDPSEW